MPKQLALLLDRQRVHHRWRIRLAPLRARRSDQVVVVVAAAAAAAAVVLILVLVAVIVAIVAATATARAAPGAPAAAAPPAATVRQELVLQSYVLVLLELDACVRVWVCVRMRSSACARAC